MLPYFWSCKRGEEMLTKICDVLTEKIRKEMPEIDDEKAEEINYGLQNIIGEIPKILLIFVISYFLGVFKWTLFTFIALFIYKGASGGIHLKTHLGCILLTTAFYCVIPLISQHFEIPLSIKIVLGIAIWIFGMIMIKLYAPADTEAIPIFEEKVKRKKKIVSYISFSVGIFIAIIIPNNTASNILLLANFVQTLTITNLSYKLTKSKHGYEVYEEMYS